MNQEDFIKSLKVVVRDAAIDGMTKMLLHPPGRRPRAKLKGLSVWYNALPAEDRMIVQEIIPQSVHSAILGTLSVLDGVVAIESAPEKGDLILTFNKDGGTTRLNGPEAELLHDIYQAMVQEEVFDE